MNSMLVHAHSGLRWVVLAILVVTIINALIKWRGQKPFTETDRKLNLFALIATHTQLVLGLILYFVSSKVVFSAETMSNPMTRFFTVEHIAAMLIAIILISMGYSRAKRAEVASTKFRLTFIYFLVGLVLILVMIPWPFQAYAANWF